MDDEIVEVRIHPAIGIMRVGNSWGYYIGPELPWERGGTIFKDSLHRVLRQAARFRLWAYWKSGKTSLINGAPPGPNPPVVDPNGPDVILGAGIQWRVSLGNKKAAWGSRNGLVVGVNRALLCIRPSEGRLDTSQGLDAVHIFDDGKISFDGQNFTSVTLGEMRTDDEGNLVMLGGFGRSESPVNAALREKISVDNDGWYDDTSDGPINADVQIPGYRDPFRAHPAWVICAPPKFAPQIDAITTLYDRLFQVSFVDPKRANADPNMGAQAFLDSYVPSFREDIAPILQRAIDMYYVTAQAQGEQLAPNPKYDNFHANQLAQFLQDPEAAPDPNDPDSGREKGVLGWLEIPEYLDYRFQLPLDGRDLQDQTYIGWYGKMPLLSGKMDSCLTVFQYTVIYKWAKLGAKGPQPGWYNDVNAPPPSHLMTPAALDQAPLEACIGAGLNPGIEAGQFLAGSDMKWIEPFRIDPGTWSPLSMELKTLEPGDITGQLSEPWQADFMACDMGWWPSARPESVFRNGPYLPGIENLPVQWAEGLTNAQDMVDMWHRLGFVVIYPNSNGHHFLTYAALRRPPISLWEELGGKSFLVQPWQR